MCTRVPRGQEGEAGRAEEEAGSVPTRGGEVAVVFLSLEKRNVTLRRLEGTERSRVSKSAKKREENSRWTNLSEIRRERNDKVK